MYRMSEPGSHKVIIVTAPSGAGKTTIVRHLLEQITELSFSVSATTRPKRGHEVDGKDYYFLSDENFQSRIDAGDFLEWEEVYSGSRYGTLRLEVDRLWSQGKSVIFDVDVKGALNLKKAYPEQSLAIFIQPPSVDALEQRLRKRETEDESSLQKRLGRSKAELEYAAQFDHVLINDHLETALEEALRLVERFLHRSGVEKA